MFPTGFFPPVHFGEDYFAPGILAGGGGGGDPIEVLWENATVLDRERRTTTLETLLIPPGDFRIMVKAVDNSGNESVNAAFVDITIVSANDIVIDQIDNPRWTGVLTDFVRHDVSELLVPSSTQDATQISVADLFTKFVPFPVAESTYETAEIDLGFDTTARVYAEISGQVGLDSSGVSDPILTIDHRLNAGAYDGFEDWTIGVITARFIKARAKIVHATGTASLKSIRIVVDIETRRESARSVTIAASGGTNITFQNAFHLIPRVDVTVDSSSALIPTVKNVTTTGFTAQVWNTSDADVGGTINWLAEGV